MAKKTTWLSDGDTWVFEEGEYAKFTPKNAQRAERADFRVITVISGNAVETDLKGLSQFDWVGPIIQWSGDYQIED